MEKIKMTEWRNIQIKDFCCLNPKTSISKGSIVKKIGMEKLTPFCRKIGGFTEESYSSGAKFQNGDTLLARITPCLENGKTAFVDILEEGEIAFGSTEFIVLRKKDGVSDALFLYYLAISPDFRERAISLMNGTSGRQRVEATPLGEEFFPLPPLDIQRKIAGILGALDDKIEVLRAQNKTLEQMAQAVFQSWFVDFDIVRAKAAGLPAADICKKYHIIPDIYDLFPSAFSADNLPLGWEKKKLGDILNISSGKRPPVKSENMTSDFYIPVYGGNGIGWYTKEPLISDGKKVIITGRVGTLGEVYRICSDAWISDNALIFYTSNDNYEFLYFWIKKINFSSYNRGAAQPLITQGDMKEIECVYPEIIIESFHNLTASCFDKIYENEKQIRTLEQTRDTLLPQLISGKIEV